MNATMIISLMVVIMLVLWRRRNATRKPIKGNGFKILYPILIFIIFIPLMVLQILFGKNTSTANLHLLPSITEMVIAFGLGLVFSIPMVLTTNYEIREDNRIYAKKSTAFVYALIGLIIIRLMLKSYFSSIEPLVLSLLSVILALGYVGVWRIYCFIKFRRVLREKNALTKAV